MRCAEAAREEVLKSLNSLFPSLKRQPKQWVHMEEADLLAVVSTVRDPHLRHSLTFGVATHHAGLHEQDRKVRGLESRITGP